MSAYTVAFEPIAIGGIDYRLASPLTWRIGRKDGPPVTVPAGFTFQVSVPGLFRWVFDPHDRRFLKAAAVHDWLLKKDWDQVTAAAIFHEALKADGVSTWRRAAMLVAVQFWKYE